MKKYLISYATPNYFKSQKKLNQSALAYGIDVTESYNLRKLKKTLFYQANKLILEQERGAGYWLWKPYIILNHLNQIQSGDCLIYSDSGIEIIRDITLLSELCAQQDGILLFRNHGHLNKAWTKRDCFVLMNCDEKKYHHAEQLSASFQVYVKNESSIKFIKEYLFYCQNSRILTDSPNTCDLENFPEFIDHRHDQSVLSILAVKYGLEIFRDPCQWGNHMKTKEFREDNEFLPMPYSEAPCTNSNYYTLLNHHRERPVKFIDQVKRSLQKIRRS